MHHAVVAIVLVCSAILLVIAGIAGIIITSNSNNPVQPTGATGPTTGSKRKVGADPANCDELKPFNLKLQQGSWVLQEKLAFPEGMTDLNVVPQRDQTSICLRTEVSEATNSETVLSTSFYMSQKLTKNYTGYIKVKQTGFWDFQVTAHPHSGVMIDAEMDKHFIFVECVSSKKVEEKVPGSVFVYTRGTLSETAMVNIRMKIDTMLRHNDETFLDFGAYCY